MISLNPLNVLVESIKKNKNNNMENQYQEISPIKCPNCGNGMDLIFGEQKVGECKHCGYIETERDHG